MAESYLRIDDCSSTSSNDKAHGGCCCSGCVDNKAETCCPSQVVVVWLLGSDINCIADVQVESGCVMI